MFCFLENAKEFEDVAYYSRTASFCSLQTCIIKLTRVVLKMLVGLFVLFMLSIYLDSCNVTFQTSLLAAKDPSHDQNDIRPVSSLVAMSLVCQVTYVHILLSSAFSIPAGALYLPLPVRVACFRPTR